LSDLPIIHCIWSGYVGRVLPGSFLCEPLFLKKIFFSDSYLYRG